MLVTNAHRGGLAIKDERTGLTDRLDHTVSSHDFRAPKESAEFWLRLERTHCRSMPSRTVLIDDNAAVLDAAERHGVSQLLTVSQPDSGRPPRDGTRTRGVQRFRRDHAVVKDSTNDAGKVRLDRWLWAARFYKTRSAAKDAIDGGRVHCGGQRAKPSKEVGVGTELEISRGDERLHRRHHRNRAASRQRGRSRAALSRNGGERRATRRGREATTSDAASIECAADATRPARSPRADAVEAIDVRRMTNFECRSDPRVHLRRRTDTRTRRAADRCLADDPRAASAR